MLIGIPAILGPDLLFTLRSMGHGDEIALVDANYPAQEHARRLVRADGHGVVEILGAILQVLPIDDFVPQALFRATVKGDPHLLDPVHDEIIAVCARRAPGFAVTPLMGEAFYGRVRNAHTIVATGEPRLYGNVIVRKGVIHPGGTCKIMIVCCGEALIDMLPRNSAAGESCFAPYVGGAVFNTAVALGRLEIPVGFFTGISTDFFGDMLTDTLSASKVDLGYVKRSDRPTTLAFVRLVDGHASYLFYDENTAGRMLTEADLPRIGPEVAAMHFSCISLIPEPCGGTYEALMRREHRDRVMMFDPNIRRSFIKDKESHLARMKRMLAMADIVKLSDEDLDWFGEAGATDEIAARWLDLGPKLMVITRGGKGAVAFSKRHSVAVDGVKVEVVDTVGAGDTINAGILAALSDHGLLTKQAIASLSEAQIRAVLAFSGKAASITVSRAGANPPWRHEMT